MRSYYSYLGMPPTFHTQLPPLREKAKKNGPLALILSYKCSYKCSFRKLLPTFKSAFFQSIQSIRPASHGSPLPLPRRNTLPSTSRPQSGCCQQRKSLWDGGGELGVKWVGFLTVCQSCTQESKCLNDSTFNALPFFFQGNKN